VNLSEKDTAGARARLDTADRTLYGAIGLIREAKDRPWQLFRNRRRMAESERALEETRLLLAACQGILDGPRTCCPTSRGESHLGTCGLSVMRSGRWNP
jgi:hypothetical protein